MSAWVPRCYSASAELLVVLRRLRGVLILILMLLLALWAPRGAVAFCGFFVSGADASLYNSVSQVVLLRNGNRTTLTMTNNYKGPPEDFALVVPVPVVLRKRDVKIADPQILRHLDHVTAPRLVEYWEQDPCLPDGPYIGSTTLGYEEVLSAVCDFTNPCRHAALNRRPACSPAKVDLGCWLTAHAAPFKLLSCGAVISHSAA